VSTTQAELVAKFAAGVVDIGGKFATGVVGNRRKFATGVIKVINEKNLKQKSRDTVPLKGVGGGVSREGAKVIWLSRNVVMACRLLTWPLF
jgi:hypothetical protein